MTTLAGGYFLFNVFPLEWAAEEWRKDTEVHGTGYEYDCANYDEYIHPGSADVIAPIDKSETCDNAQTTPPHA